MEAKVQNNKVVRLSKKDLLKIINAPAKNARISITGDYHDPYDGTGTDGFIEISWTEESTISLNPENKGTRNED